MSAAVRVILLLACAWSVSPNAHAGSVSGAAVFPEGPAAGAVVVMIPDPAPKPPPKPVSATIVQKDLRFSPRLTVVSFGGTLRFENHDNEMHNVQSATKTNRFDVGAHLPAAIKEVALNNPGGLVLRCKIHPEMKAYVFVSPSPIFATTDRSGSFRIGEVPGGRYRAEVWHPRLSRKEMEAAQREVEIGEGETRVTFDLRPGAPPEADLVELSDDDFGRTVAEIRAALDEVGERWAGGSKTAALMRMLTTHSRLYGESGFRAAVAVKLGETEAKDYDERFEGLAKAVQKVNPSTQEIEKWKREAAALLDRLQAAARRLADR